MNCYHILRLFLSSQQIGYALNTANESGTDNRKYCKASMYKSEIMSFCHPYAYSPILALFSLPSAISVPSISLLSDVIAAMPIQQANCPMSDMLLPTAYQHNVELKCRLNPSSFTPSTNHFVPTFP
ncbi:7478_t:CDS:1 [Paraglomus brasilianum]|uniref:7478_t:CDS:1 n=1 Tax=Paraglomus brasilianum TaxID=144538 RepID=A0A9N9FIL7_9GLOM|nr:7478_t:CDS:1 [Paraglomus brasilianum]